MWQAAVSLRYLFFFTFLKPSSHEKCRSLLVLLCGYRRPQVETDRQTHREQGGGKKDRGNVCRDDIPVGSHLSGVEGHKSIRDVAIVCSFAFLLLSLLLPAVILHHLFFLLRLDGHLAPVDRLHFPLLAQIWRKHKHKHLVNKSFKKFSWTGLNYFMEYMRIYSFFHRDTMNINAPDNLCMIEYACNNMQVTSV